jgi:hypothetical protein
MAVSVTDKPLILIAELNKKFKEAQNNAGHWQWTEISNLLRMAAAAGDVQIVVEVPQSVASFIDKRLKDAGLYYIVEDGKWTITGWADWKDPEEKAK